MDEREFYRLSKYLDIGALLLVIDGFLPLLCCRQSSFQSRPHFRRNLQPFRRQHAGDGGDFGNGGGSEEQEGGYNEQGAKREA